MFWGLLKKNVRDDADNVAYPGSDGARSSATGDVSGNSCRKNLNFLNTLYSCLENAPKTWLILAYST